MIRAANGPLSHQRRFEALKPNQTPFHDRVIGRQFLGNDYVNGEFLAYFTFQCFPGRLALLDLPTGKLPSTARRSFWVSATRKKSAIALDDRGDYPYGFAFWFVRKDFEAPVGPLPPTHGRRTKTVPVPGRGECWPRSGSGHSAFGGHQDSDCGSWKPRSEARLNCQGKKGARLGRYTAGVPNSS